jgi:hypothetical protein
MQREEKPVMETGLERIAARARKEPRLRFTSLAHHITRERVWKSLCHIPADSAPGGGWPDGIGGEGGIRLMDSSNAGGCPS